MTKRTIQARLIFPFWARIQMLFGYKPVVKFVTNYEEDEDGEPVISCSMLNTITLER